jgi:hypothetical protein
VTLDAWRFALLANRIGELFAIAQAADVPRLSVFDPRSVSAKTGLGTDPFASAVWAMDQALADLPGALNDAEFYVGLAECEVIAHRQPRGSTVLLRARGERFERKGSPGPAGATGVSHYGVLGSE